MPIPLFTLQVKLLLTGLLFTMLSCSDLPSEADAIKQNQKGVELMDAGKPELALIEFMASLHNSKLTKLSKGTIYRNIALAYDELKKQDSSIHYYTIAAKSFRKNSYDYLVNMASVELHSGKIEAALSRLTKAAIMNPDELSVNNTLGLIYMGDYDEAYTDIEKALVYNKKAFEIDGGKITENILGRNYYELKQYELAELHFEHILQQYPDETDCSFSYGMIKYKLEKKAEGDKLFEKVLSQDSTYKASIDIFRENNK